MFKVVMAKKEMKVEKGVDLQRYMGRWYEIASFPSRFQPKNGANTRATYTLKEDGSVHVLNETFSDGKRGFIEGTAYKADPNSDEAKLKVKFYVPPFLPIIPVVGDYWVLFLDQDYQYALIGQPSRKYLWILSRKPDLDEEIYKELVEKAKEEGYDVSKLQKTPQSDRPEEAEEGPRDTKGFWWIKSILGK
ncbi:temperature-induced lipocalin-1-like isoform X3 [Vigna unguiculata]|uniref:temperature-induced lipocalin-1-like isoform X3 n=1 Tax=Vigna unguiculata TaxID=3917 RepID=UPI00101714A1|nr:temperature-induced lipocalin-1-like isoform X3 [Vigna unguiculata]